MTQSRVPNMCQPAVVIGKRTVWRRTFVPRNTTRHKRPVSDELNELPVAKRKFSDALIIGGRDRRDRL